LSGFSVIDLQLAERIAAGRRETAAAGNQGRTILASVDKKLVDFPETTNRPCLQKSIRKDAIWVRTRAFGL
jgi:hypothetical protein